MSVETPGAARRPRERPASFRDVFESREYRMLFSANVLSWLGDYLAKAAVSALVYQETRSVWLSAATFALSYLPWLVGGPVLAALAERRRFRSVMVGCDLVRMVAIGIVAIPGLPLEALFALLFVTALASPPFQAARSAVLPQILQGDRFVVGLALQQSVGQAAQVVGFAAGAAIAAVDPHLALVINAVTFGLSGLLIRLGLHDRRAIGLPPERRHILRETIEGYEVIFRSQVMRAIALVVFVTMFFGIVPEGLAAAWAWELTRPDAGPETAATFETGLVQAMIMVANPIGFILGGLLIGRLVTPERRIRLIPVFAVLTPLALVPAVFEPSVFGIAAMAAVCGFAIAGMFPAANGLFVQVLPSGYRARAFGVMQSGVQLAQGIAVLATGVLAGQFSLPVVVGAWSIGGVLVVLLISTRWPRQSTIEAAVRSGEAANAAAAEAARRSESGSGPPDQSGPTRGDSEPAGDMPRPAVSRRGSGRHRTETEPVPGHASL